MKTIYTCFPGGRFKALTLSYDDGKVMDRRLVELFNRYGLKATFHLNSGLLGEKEGHRYPYVEAGEVRELYRGHEIACHTCTHPTLTRTPKPMILEEILEDRKKLEKLSGYPVIGMSYPNGVFSKEIKEAMRQCGICYARTTKDTGRFYLPEDYLEWNPTCRHTGPLMELTREFLNREYDQRLCLFYVWGHSYEFEQDQNWEQMEAFAREAGGRDEIWYASNLEIYDYMKAASELRFTADCSRVFNPSALDVWIKADGIVCQIPAGETRELGGENRKPYYLDQEKRICYHPSPSGEGKMDPVLVRYREGRPPKTSGNPYYYLGEPIGDLRDNMYPQALPLAKEIKIEKRKVAGIPVRFYEKDSEEKGRPCLVFLHGGAFIGGSAETVEEPCRLLAELSGALVISVEYSPAPEAAFPRAIEECCAVLEEVWKDPEVIFDRGCLFLGGDSAGGNLALVCLQEKEIRRKISGSILLYPVTDLSGKQELWSWKAESYRGGKGEMERHCASSLAGSEKQMKKLYVQGKAEATDPRISPIYMKVPEDFPRTLLITAEYDYLRMQGEAFGRKLSDAGIPVRISRYGGMCHAFFDLLGHVEQAGRCVGEMAEFLAEGRLSEK